MPIDFDGIKTTGNREYDAQAISEINDSLQYLSPRQRAYILGTIIEESGGNPLAKSDNDTYQGLIQWGEDRYRIQSNDKRKELVRQLQEIRKTLNNTTDNKSWTHGGEDSGYQSFKDAYNDFNDPNISFDDGYRAFSFGYVRPEGKEDSYNNRLKVAKQVYDRIIEAEHASESSPAMSYNEHKITFNPPIHVEHPDVVRVVKPTPHFSQRKNTKQVMQDIVDHNKFMESIKLQNNPKPQYQFPIKFSEGGPLQIHKTWDDLSMTEKADMMKVAVRNGITSLNEIKAHYNEFAEGGNLYGGGSYLDKAKAMIRANEGWRGTPYKDAPKGKNWRSVGYGFNDSGFWEKYPEGISKHYEKGMTKAQAEQELAYYLGKAERQLRGIYGKRWDSFNDDQKAAILDTYYQSPASVGSKSGFYSAVMAGRDGAPYLGVRGFGDRNQSRRDLYRGRGVSAPMTFDTVSEPVSAEPEMISFKPLNPQAFDNPMFTYTPPTLMEEPVQVNPLAEAYNPEELERQEKRDNLERFNMFMNMLSGSSSEDNTGLTGMLGAISMLSGNKKAEGGNIYDGDTEPTQQMQQGYIRQRPEGTYFYDVEGQPEIDVTPLNTSLSSNPADWSFTDALGKIYSPHRDTVQGTGELREGSQEGPILSAVNNYLRELNWRAKNDPSSIALQGKYTIPAIAATGLLPWLGEAAAATNVAGVPLMTWADAGLTAGFGAHGLNHLMNEDINGWGDAAMTALEVAPLGRLAKPVWNASKEGLRYTAKVVDNAARYASPSYDLYRTIGETTPRTTPTYRGVRLNGEQAYTGSPLFEFANIQRTSPSESYFFRAPNDIDILKLWNGRFRSKAQGNIVLPSGNVNGKFVSYGEPWQEFDFGEGSALYEFPVGPRRGPSRMATDWRGNKQDFSVDEAYEFMQQEKALSKELRELRNKGTINSEREEREIRKRLIQDKYALVGDTRFSSSINSANQTVIPNERWNFDWFLKTPFWKYSENPISGQVQKELMMRWPEAKVSDIPTIEWAKAVKSPQITAENAASDIRYFKDDFGKEVPITPYPGTDAQLIDATNKGHLAALRHQFSQDKTEQLKSIMGWDDAAIAEYQDEILRSFGNAADIQVKGTNTGFKEIGNHKGKIYQNGESVSHSMMLNRDRIPDDATAMETGIHEMGVHGRTLHINPSETEVEGSYSNTVAQKFPRIAEVMKKNQEIAKQTLIPNDKGKLFQQIKKSSDLERWLYENNVPAEQWEKYFNDWKYYKYVTEDQELLARGYTGQVYETIDPSRKTLNIQQLKKFFTPESTEKYKKTVLSVFPFLFARYGLSQENK